jgi:hypothetical protein
VSTAAQITANRANAQLSTGPTSQAGKSRSSFNAVKTALTGRTILLPGDDVESYTALVARFTKDLEPIGEEETLLVQSIVDTLWRLFRIPSLESAIYALGHIECKHLFPEETDPAVRFQLIQAKVYLDNSRQIERLITQEARLHRQQEKNYNRLRELKEERDRQRSCRLSAVAKEYLKAVDAGQKPEFIASTQAIGFEFSIDEIEVRAASFQSAFDRHRRTQRSAPSTNSAMTAA